MFNKHPKEVGMTYFQHMKFAIKMSLSLFVLSITTLIHAIFPFLFVENVSNFIKETHMKLENRKCENCNCCEKNCNKCENCVCKKCSDCNCLKCDCEKE